MKETYPVSKPKLPQHLSQSTSFPPTTEYGETLDAFEENIFRAAHHFSVVRFGTHNSSECAVTDSFPRALWLAHQQPRTLIYCVTEAGRAFCMPEKEYGKYAQLYLEMRG